MGRRTDNETTRYSIVPYIYIYNIYNRMSIPWRAARKPLFGKSEDTPGPDAYELQNVGRPKSTPPYVAFHTTSNRSDIAKGASGAGVAPGSYNIKGSVNVEIAKGKSNIFRSKSSRFAPTAPGSSVYRPSTILENPGPGNYTLSGFADKRVANINEEKLRKAAPKPRPQSVTEVFTNRQMSAPSVPRPSQSFGYEENSLGKLVLQEAPSVVFSGLKQDQIAPNHYFEEGYNGNRKKGVIGFGLSKTSRKVFEPVGNDKVGPGRYTPSVLSRSEVTPNQEGSSAFLSKTPMAHQKGAKKKGDGDSVDDFMSGRGTGPGSYNVNKLYWQKAIKSGRVGNFNTMEKRGSLGRDLSAPFTDSKNLNPGPGTYGEKRTSFTYKARKKLTTEKIGFDSSDKRPCLKKDEPEEEKIGLVEGQKYEEGEMPNTIASRLTSKMNIGAIGAFGATETRFRGGPFDASKNAEMPGPGAYDTRGKVTEGVNKNGDKDEGEKMDELYVLTASKSTSAFRSNTTRFGSNGKGSSGHQRAPDAGAYYSPAKWVKDPVGGRSLRASQLSFASTNGRFGNKHEQAMIWGTPMGRRPGPGQYRTDRHISVSNIRRVQQHRRNPRIRSKLTQTYSIGSRRSKNNRKTNMTMGLASRFSNNRKHSDNLGPGTYKTTGSMIKKSYNVTMH